MTCNYYVATVTVRIVWLIMFNVDNVGITGHIQYPKPLFNMLVMS